LGYLVKVDGLKIFYPGNRGYQSKEVWKDYAHEIDSLQENANVNEAPMKLSVDIAFLPVPDSRVQQQEQRLEIEEGVARLLNRLQSAVWFPMTPEGDEYMGIQFAESIKKNQPTATRVYCPEQRGDRFSYK
jgi:hypothetical protein